jgi:hypothetical protein
MSQTAEYRSWKAMKERCLNPNHQAFEHYGGRGILPCEDYRGSFDEFFADLNDRPPGCSLHRIDNDRGYERGNCCWADAQTQAQNRRPPRKRVSEPLPAPLEDPPF